ncbi:MTH1187 family thiamine-binding protein [Desulfobacter curvatus]|uniref:MTH1187 family thiamine-binding protein n=1 Tax=Desulfobacter curvatus TaxID=2290 RepID=UPI000363B9A8|nr:MTH1187 family thiamine-binding protein [Desulfobacter curvatus]
MNTLVAVAIAPSGTGDELSNEVAQVIKIIRESGLKNRTNSMFTEIEGPWDDVMKVVKDATFVLAEKGIRTEVVLKADVRPGFTDMMTSKVDKVNGILQGTDAHEK